MGFESQLEKVILIRVVQQQAWWFLFETFLESCKFKFGNSVPTSKNYTEAKKGSKFRKGFQKMEVNIICENFVLIDFINPFGVSGDSTGYINIQRPTYLLFWKDKIVVHEGHFSK